ncbi:hypothetical protein FOL47_010036 [Perkinsus chesapeaki]|uniref:adenosine kinase n=1 Tax=Perkinsus chesapeaki TaxID=330153 RepID=A0A7J6L546_PERCH|nr:hypothetical protein FOL47_010036 [Perkinsus chesapeaki]
MGDASQMPSLVGMGNPLLDISVNTDSAILDRYKLESNNAILADDSHLPLYPEITKMPGVEYIAGGATQNSLRVAQWMLGGRGDAAFIGCVGRDHYADIMQKNCQHDGVITRYLVDESTPTGTCAVLVTHEGQRRSLVANLSAAIKYDHSHIIEPDNWRLIEHARIVYSAGFFVAVSPKAIEMVSSKCIETGALYCMNVAAPYIVEVPDFKKVVFETLPKVDILFGNEVEAKALAKALEWDDSMSIPEIAVKLAEMPMAEGKKRGRKVVITQGPLETYIANTGRPVAAYDIISIPDHDIVDTNAAGDAYVGGFLAGLLKNCDDQMCAAAGAYAAWEVIKQSGCKFPEACAFKFAVDSTTTIPPGEGAVSLVAITVLLGLAVLLEKYVYDHFYKKIAPYKTGDMRRKMVPAKFNAHPHALQGLLPDVGPDSPFKGDAGLFPLKSTGDKIFWETFVPTDVDEPKGVIVLCHGYADHSGFHMFNDARMFCEKEKYACVLFDQISSGRSDGLQAYIDDWFKYCQLAKEFIDEFILGQFVPSLADRSVHLPFYGYGHSMGGCLVTSLSILHPTLFDGLIMQSPMLKIPQSMHPSWIVEELLRGLAKLFPKAPVVPTKNLGAIMYHHKDAHHYSAKYNILAYRGRPRLCTALSLLQGQDFVSGNFKSVTTPFIICHGAADEITDPQADVELYNESPAKSESRVCLYPGLRHYITGMQEPEESQKVFDDMFEWIENRTVEVDKEYKQMPTETDDHAIEGETVTERPSLPKEMDAFYWTGFGGPEVCKNYILYRPTRDVCWLTTDAPAAILCTVASANQHVCLCRVQVHYASLNPADYQQRNGEAKHLLKYNFPKVFGFDFSGDVVQVGSEVKDFKIGEAVFGMVSGVRTGTTAEYVLVDDYVCALKPSEIPHHLAAAVPLVGITAEKALNKCNINEMHQVLVTGGSGGVGSIAIQLCKAEFGIKWVATTSSEQNRGLVESFGADEVFDYKCNNRRWAEQFDSGTWRHAYDVVFDTQGDYKQAVLLLGDSTDGESPEDAGGMVSIVDGPSAEAALEWLKESHTEPKHSYIKSFLENFSWIWDAATGVRSMRKKAKGKYWTVIGTGDGDACRRLATMLESKSIVPHIDGVYPLSQAKDALAKVESGRTKGKVLVEDVFLCPPYGFSSTELQVIADPKESFVEVDDSMEAVEGSSEQPMPSSPSEEGVEVAREAADEAEKSAEEAEGESKDAENAAERGLKDASKGAAEAEKAVSEAMDAEEEVEKKEDNC